jgi:Lamin Tail Domain
MPRKFISCFCILLFSNFVSNAQLLESFDDGDFTGNPSWSVNSPDFIVNAAFQLQSNNNVANSNYFLSAPNSLALSAQWEMYIQIQFNPSSANYIDACLIASNSNLSLTNTTGYFVRIGNTDDEISLYRKDNNGVITKIIDGENGILNNSNNTIKLKVIRKDDGQWILYRDLTGTGNSYLAEGSVIDTTYMTSAYFGFYIRQSTPSFFQKHFFDNIEIKNYEPDVTAPSLSSVQITSSNTINVLFDEPVETSSSETVSNYILSNAGNPVSAVHDANNPALIHLSFTNQFTTGVGYTLNINGVKDLLGNALNNALANLTFYTEQRFDVVIDEIMADPTPAVGMPAVEWIELKNTTNSPVNMEGWRIITENATSGNMPSIILQPDSCIIVCAASATPSLSSFGKTVGVSNFPSLNNDGGVLALYSSTGHAIHAVQYSSAWYQNELKKDGGWSLEMIDTKNPCVGKDNWKASIDNKGGTPGKINSVNGNANDETSPKLLRAFAINDTSIILVYDESLDSNLAAKTENYSVDKSISLLKATAIPPLFDKVKIILDKPLKGNIIYSITASNVSDCKGNMIGMKNNARFGLAEEAAQPNVAINEILYNPKPQGVDYVELYNRSQKIIDLSHIYIANRNSSNTISSIQRITIDTVLLLPGDFVLVSADPDAVKKQYITTNPDVFISTSPMPSFPDDAGDVIILNSQGEVLDDLKYSDKWQFPLIANSEGVSLERIDYDGPSEQSNFHSGATSAGYGTPGYKNSQYRLNEEIKGSISVYPEIFSPDNDGIDDFATLAYSFPSPGYVSNINIFDASGRLVRHLQRNALNGLKGEYRWDGLDDKNLKLPQGIYIVFTEIFNTAGVKRLFKNTIVLARRY